MNSEILLGDDGRNLFKAVSVVYDYLTTEAKYRFVDIDLSKQTFLEGANILIGTSGQTFENDYIKFVHGSSHTFTITYKANVNVYNAMTGAKIAEKQVGTDSNINLLDLIDGGSGGNVRYAFFVPAYIA